MQETQTKSTPRLVSIGEIMLRLDCPPGQRFRRHEHFTCFYGGAEANVCAALEQLGITTRYVTALPLSELGLAASDALQAFGVDISYVHRSEERLGIYFTEHGSSIRPSRVIYDRKNSAFASLKPGKLDWNSILDKATYFFWTGITPALSQQSADVCREAILSAKSKVLQIAADMNYRRSLWDYGKLPSDVMPELLSHCTIITGDIDTIGVYFGIQSEEQSQEDSFAFFATRLKEKLPAMKTLAMSFRGTDQYHQQTYKGALMKDGSTYFSKTFSLPQVVDRIGSGDAFQAGLLYAAMENLSPVDSIHFATACGALKHSTEGDLAIFSKEDVWHFAKNGAISQVIR